MDENTAFQQLVNKVRGGNSIPEEDLTLLQYLNDAAKLLVIVANELKIDQLKNAIKQNSHISN